MSARKKTAAKATEPKADEPKAGESTALEGPEPYVALPNVYRADLGESLPPQKSAGVE
jgi:hypothetical protein